MTILLLKRKNTAATTTNSLTCSDKISKTVALNEATVSFCEEQNVVCHFFLEEKVTKNSRLEETMAKMKRHSATIIKAHYLATKEYQTNLLPVITILMTIIIALRCLHFIS